MAEQIKLHSFRKEVDSTYVGFTPNGGSIKPVHVANGVQRCIFGGFNTAMQIKRLALVSDAKGNVPTGSELETICFESQQSIYSSLYFSSFRQSSFIL